MRLLPPGARSRWGIGVTNDQYSETFFIDTAVAFSKKTAQATLEVDLVAALFLTDDR
ncbi:MAG: hypothetical protein V7K27_00160 [Nostoc sp.]|uniref:hypothetical protein n=1 Tax=Nostoc sp. TaxID=1180 RepID=UPI002FFCED4C